MEVGASIVGLVAVGAKIAVAVHQFVSSCNNAPLFARSILQEMLDFNYALTRIQDLIVRAPETSLNASRTSMIDVNHLSFTLCGCMCTLSELEKEITRLKLSGKLGVWDRVKWSLTERAINSIIQRIQGHKISLMLMLTILTGPVSDAINSQQTLCQHLSRSGSSPIDDDSNSIRSVSTITRNLYRHAFESTLRVSRPYIRERRFNDGQSIISVATSQRSKGGWSLHTANTGHSVLSLPLSVASVSGTSLADIPSIRSLTLPVTSVFNPKWYDSDIEKPSNPRETDHIGSFLAADSAFFLDAVRKGLIGVVVQFLDRITDQSLIQPGILDHALCEAVRSKQVAVTEALIDRGAAIEAGDKNGFRALHFAAGSGHKEILELLLDRGAGIEAGAENGFRALHSAANKGHKEILELLLDRGAAIEAGDESGYSALHIAADIGNKEILELLLDHGAAIEAGTKRGLRALHVAARSGNKEILELLLDRGTAIEAGAEKGYRAFHFAAKFGNKEILEILLDRGAAIEAEAESGYRALHFAAEFGNKEILELLLDRGAAIEAGGENGCRALHVAARFGHKEILELLLDRGAAIEAGDENGYRALYLAVSYARKEILELLLDRGAEIETRDSNGHTPLFFLCRVGWSDMAELLLKRGADCKAKAKDGQTPLHLAAMNGNMRVAELLLDRGAAIQAKDQYGLTPLHLAARNSNEDLEKFLLDREAAMEADDENDRTDFPVLPTEQVILNPTPSPGATRLPGAAIFRPSGSLVRRKLH